MKPVIDVNDPAFNNGTKPPGGLLDGYQVNLFTLLDEGIPEPEYVPGCEGWLRQGKRYLIPAPAGAGKSLAWLVIAVGVVERGGTVAILDVENGAAEYARRLGSILDARGNDVLPRHCQHRLQYYEWPRLSLKWNAEEWVATIGAANLVTVDSSRLALSQVGLDEDSSNCYAEFIDALVLPLAKAGITTVILDNTGHEHGQRARGTKSKDDLNEVTYTLSAQTRPDIDTTGTLSLKLTRTRFSGLHRQLEMRCGGGVYEMPRPVEQSYDQQGNWRPTHLMGRVADYVQEHPGAGTREIREHVSGNNEYLGKALHQLVSEGFVEARNRGPGRIVEHHLVKPFVDGK